MNDDGYIQIERESAHPRQQSDIYLLVLGRSGSGKSYHIENAFCKKRGTASYPYYNTIITRSKSAIISGHKFRFIDTPGFDNPCMSDAEVLAEIGDYFLHPASLRISGVLYIHQAGDSLRSRALERIFAVLSGTFLGPVGLSRLTILVACDNTRAVNSGITQELRHTSSVFNRLIVSGTRTEIFNLERNGFQDVLKAYSSKRCITLPIQLFSRMSRPNFVSHMEDLLGCYSRSALQTHLKAQEQKLENSFDVRVQRLNSELEDKNIQLAQYRTVYEQDEGRRNAQGEEIEALNQKLLQSQQEYSSLRSQLQLQENFEQSEVVQELRDLNRRIENIGRSCSAHLTDKYVFATFGKDFDKTTTLDARDLPELKQLLGHVDGKPSLVTSVQGKGMEVEGFLDFSIRTLLCTFLYRTIFCPFHPSISVNQSHLLHSTYADIRQREPQAVAGKWRSNTFKSIYIPPSTGATESDIRNIATDFLNTRLNALIVYFFGQVLNPLETHHLDNLQDLIKVAWEWNAKLKGAIVMLGDFRITAYKDRFHPKCMEEFEPDEAKPQAKHVLGTLALGLISQRAVGGGQPLDEVLVCKALVATENLYL
ncbi:unnamed protein product [Rhizoctonia solani]|uniref:G domain-containing protein n=1 Tax=Rhizoctonia solani TaxID=456999 RepID=A0A8H3H121_9AGAM|nr:unnamed protein product [Rhizoctonia solani]